MNARPEISAQDDARANPSGPVIAPQAKGDCADYLRGIFEIAAADAEQAYLCRELQALQSLLAARRNLVEQSLIRSAISLIELALEQADYRDAQSAYEARTASQITTGR